MNLIPLTAPGQLQAGDLLLIERRNQVVCPAEVKEVIRPGTEQEEIVLARGRNLYFVVSMFLRGESWIKECSKVVNGRVYSITNNLRDISMDYPQ